MTGPFHPDQPTTWLLKIPIIAHDVGRTNDRSTAVIGGLRPLLPPRVLGVQQFVELPLGLYGTELASALAEIDRQYRHDCLIVVDLSRDPTYAEALYDTFGPRVIGLQIGRSGDGTTFERRLVRNSAMPVYRVGRTQLFDHLLNELRANQVRLAEGPESRRAFDQLVGLQYEQRDSGMIYSCPSGQHDDLAISMAMLDWAAHHPHWESWTRPIYDQHRPRRPRRPPFNWGMACT
jgi:hypothetical protein